MCKNKKKTPIVSYKAIQQGSVFCEINFKMKCICLYFWDAVLCTLFTFFGLLSSSLLPRLSIITNFYSEK